MSDETEGAKKRQYRSFKQLPCKGEIHSANEWSVILNIAVSTIYQRLHKGWSIEEALGFVPHKRPTWTPKTVARYTLLIPYEGQAWTLKEWAAALGCKVAALRNTKCKVGAQ